MLNKKTLCKKWYYRLLQTVFWCAFIFLMLLGVLGVLYEDDMPFVGFVWAGVLVVVWWLAKKILYYFMFGERI